jgi:hypothetical protein
MAIQFSTAVRNARLDAFESTTGTTAKLRILTGSPPANCGTAESGSLLCELTLPSDWLDPASGGTKAKAGTWSGTASGTGTAGYFRIVDNAGTTCHQQGTVTATGGGGDMTVDNTSIASSQTVTVTGYTLTDGNA